MLLYLAAMNVLGMLLAGRIELKSKKALGAAAGLVLIAIGVKMLVEKLG